MTTEEKTKLRELAEATDRGECQTFSIPPKEFAGVQAYASEGVLMIKRRHILALLDENKRLETPGNDRDVKMYNLGFTAGYSATSDSKSVATLKARVAKLEAALKFYAQGKLNSNDDLPEGTRLEFGCGCCTGTLDAEGLNNYDHDVIGLTAREALAETGVLQSAGGTKTTASPLKDAE